MSDLSRSSKAQIDWRIDGSRFGTGKLGLHQLQGSPHIRRPGWLGGVNSASPAPRTVALTPNRAGVLINRINSAVGGYSFDTAEVTRLRTLMEGNSWTAQQGQVVFAEHEPDGSMICVKGADVLEALQGASLPGDTTTTILTTAIDEPAGYRNVSTIKVADVTGIASGQRAVVGIYTANINSVDVAERDIILNTAISTLNGGETLRAQAIQLVFPTINNDGGYDAGATTLVLSSVTGLADGDILTNAAINDVEIQSIDTGASSVTLTAGISAALSNGTAFTVYRTVATTTVEPKPAGYTAGVTVIHTDSVTNVQTGDVVSFAAGDDRTVSVVSTATNHITLTQGLSAAIDDNSVVTIKRTSSGATSRDLRIRFINVKDMLIHKHDYIGGSP